MTQLHGNKNRQTKGGGALRRAALVAIGATLMGGSCLAAEIPVTQDAWENLAQIAAAGASDSALAGSRGMGSEASLPDALAVILWDEKNTCCVKPGIAPAPAPEGGMNSVSFRVVIQR